MPQAEPYSPALTLTLTLTLTFTLTLTRKPNPDEVGAAEVTLGEHYSSCDPGVRDYLEANPIPKPKPKPKPKPQPSPKA